MSRRHIFSLAFLLLFVGSVAFAADQGRPLVTPFKSAPGDHTQVLAPKLMSPTAKLPPFRMTFTSGNPVDAALAVGNRLVDIQADVTEDNAGNGGADADADDGGWDWVTTGATEHPAGASYENLYGPIARGLVDAAIATGDARLGVGSGDVFSGISQAGTGLLSFPYYRIWDADLSVAAVRWADFSGDASVADTLKARHDTEIIVRGGAGGRARTVRNGRLGQGIGGLWPWDIHLLSNDSKALAAAYPGDAAMYEAEVDSVAQMILDDMNGLLGVPTAWDPTDFTESYHQTAIAGALRAMVCSGIDNVFATALRDTLVNGQLANGSWGVSYSGTFYPDDVQTTAYAVLALLEYADALGPDAAATDAARAGNAWLMTQIDGSGVVDAGGGSEYAEVSGEVAQAVLAGSIKLGLSSIELESDCLVAGNNDFSVDVTITDIMPDPSTVQGMKLNFSYDASELTLNSITVPAGSIWGSTSDYIDFTTVGGGAGEIDVSSLLFGGFSAGSGGLVCRLNFTRVAVGIMEYEISGAEVRDHNNSPIAADLTDAGGRARRILGDFTTTLTGGPTDCGPPAFGPPDGDVDVFDLDVFSNHFGALDPAAEYCCFVDIGPTSSGYIFGEPLVDGAIDFEDLIIFAISFGYSTVGGYLGQSAIDSSPAVVRLVQIGDGAMVMVDVEVTSQTGVQGLHAILDYDPAMLRFVRAERVGNSGNFIAVVPGDGVDLNVAALGATKAWVGSGNVARLVFERIAEGQTPIRLIDLDGRDNQNRTVPLSGHDLTVGAAVPSQRASVSFLAPVSPNPVVSGHGATVRFGSSKAQSAKLAVFDAQGRVVRALLSGNVSAGEHTLIWDGRDRSGARAKSGIYFVRLGLGDFQATRKVTLQ